MKRQNVVLLSAALVVGIFVLTSLPLAAQSIWLDHGYQNSVGIEFFKPNFDGNFIATDFLTSALFLSGRFGVSQNLFFVGELPIARIGFKEDFAFLDNQLNVGNPYLGLEAHQENSFIEMGVRLPLMSEDGFSAATAGVTSDYDRLEAFIPNTVPALLKVNYRKKTPSNFVLRLRGGPVLLINTEDNGDRFELLMDYSAQVGVEAEMIHVMAGFTGRYFATTDDGDFGERSIHQVGVGANLVLGNLRPGIHLRFPLDDDLKDEFDYIFGLNLAYGLQ
jgi:hypothetical protein